MSTGCAVHKVNDSDVWVRFGWLLVGLFALHSPAVAGGSDVVWSTNPDIPTVFSNTLVGPSADSPVLASEVADDFNVIGTIEHILADGETCNNGCFGSPDGVTGVWVRFYEWTAAGPGQLQMEQFVAFDQGFFWTPTCCMELLDITLPKPFEASGLHFISVQAEIGGADNDDQWNFYGLNHNDTMGAPAYFRDMNGSGAWEPAGPAMGFANIDVSFQLSGIIIDEPMPDMIFTDPADGTVNPSGRLVISGSTLGSGLGAQVVIDGQPAIISEWESDKITLYVPEGVSPGPVEMQLIVEGETVDTMPLTIEPRVSNGQVKWVFEGDAPYSLQRAAEGADGTLYFEDIRAKLYAISPEGGLLWMVDALRGQQGNGDEGPIAVGDDGTVYVATNPLGMTVDLVAFNPDGTHKWTFTVPNALTWQAGPSIGPDGRIYGALNAAANLGNEYELFALNVDGSVAWTASADPAIFENAARGQEIVFGPSSPGGPVDQMLFTSDQNGAGRNWGFDLDDGSQNFAAPICAGNDVGQGQLAGNPDSGAFYMMEFGCGGAGWGLQSFDADGDRSWRFDPGIASGASHPAVDGDGNIYLSWDLLRITSVDSSGSERWTVVTDDVWYNTPIPSPTAPTFIIHGTRELGANTNTFVEARNTSDGSLIWAQDIVDAHGQNVAASSKPRFSADGQVAYFSALEIPITTVSTYRVFAIDMTEGASSVTGDVNSDQVVDTSDLLMLLAAWGSCEGCPEDLNNDGLVGVADLLMLLNNWG